MLRNKATILFVLIMIVSVCGIQTVAAVEGPFIFHWGIRNNISPGFEDYTPVPHPGHDYTANHVYYTTLYSQMADANSAVCLMLQPDTNPIDGATDKYALSTVMGYVSRLDFVWADFEDVDRDAKMLEVISQLRNHSDPDINSAYVANYGDYPGAIDVSAQ